MIRPPPSSTLFPSTTLFHSDPQDRAGSRRLGPHVAAAADDGAGPAVGGSLGLHRPGLLVVADEVATAPSHPAVERAQDRKSTRLNSSHANISYAVFCLKKKK